MSNSRLEKLRAKLEEQGLDAIMISQAENRRYVSGFAGSAGLLFVSAKRAALATDFRYAEQAKTQAPGWEEFQTVGGPEKWFPGLVQSLGASRMGFEARDITFTGYRQFAETLKAGPKEINLVPTESVVETLRAIKDQMEIERIRKAAALVDAALETVVPRIRAGVSEKQVAWYLESFMREKGSEPMPFDIIAA